MCSIEDILADSDSDYDEMDDGTGKSSKPTKKTKNQASFIQEDPDNIVDLADVNAIGRITCKWDGRRLSYAFVLINRCFVTASKPLPKTGNALIDAENKKKPKDSNRGFQTADDGRLIIAEPRRGGRGGAAESESEDDFDMDDAGGDAAAKNLSGGNKKRTLNSSDESDDEDEEDAPSRKRALLSTASMASGKTGASSRYVAGGRGIHRPTNGAAASVRSGVSRVSAATGRSAGGASAAGSNKFGDAFKAKKAGGDVKKGKVDPYAYIPLSRQSMNKR